MLACGCRSTFFFPAFRYEFSVTYPGPAHFFVIQVRCHLCALVDPAGPRRRRTFPRNLRPATLARPTSARRVPGPDSIGAVRDEALRGLEPEIWIDALRIRVAPKAR